jgi:hypothetical protein
MTIEEINALILDDVKTVVQSRVFGKKDPLPQYDEENDGEYEAWYEAQFTQEELDAEFLVYKQELLDAENERLRKEDLKSRFENLKDMRGAFHSVHSEPNPAIWLKQLLESDHSEAETKMQELEAKDIELQPSVEEVEMKEWDDAITKELSDAGISERFFLYACVQALRGKTEYLDSLEPKLLEIDNKHPRPNKGN